jgi:hypothetical protein
MNIILSKDICSQNEGVSILEKKRGCKALQNILPINYNVTQMMRDMHDLPMNNFYMK